MKKLKTLTMMFVTLILGLALIQGAKGQTSDEIHTFFAEDYAGISLQVNATEEADPGENIAVNLWINCTADGVYVDRLNISVYGYRHFRYGLEKVTLNVTCMIENNFLAYNHTSEYNYIIHVPNDVWDVTYAELSLKYAIKGLPIEYNVSFPITVVRNVLWEELEKTLKWLNESYQQLNNTCWQLNSTYRLLNQTFWESFRMNLTAENLALLNNTYWELQGNYTTLQASISDLDNARRAVAVLAVTTVFFVATTVYSVMRKPKQSW